jgi:lipoyl-dependent peroxiredoxin
VERRSSLGFNGGRGTASSRVGDSVADHSIQRRIHTTEEIQMPTRGASARWEGGLKGGTGTFSTATGLSAEYSFTSRFESGTGSNPEELLAAAEAACYSMAFSGALERNGTPPTKVETSAKCTVERVNDAFTITRIELTVEAVVPSIDDATFQKIASTARDNCPVSRALKGNVDIQLNATLAG